MKSIQVELPENWLRNSMRWSEKTGSEMKQRRSVWPCWSLFTVITAHRRSDSMLKFRHQIVTGGLSFKSLKITLIFLT